ncbi:hypothetical protein A3Q56_02796 [Intoshia linei]|uniref:C2H2-type domain-containing protein n=1 Tax=Intoshia linei TaxID=1819745 RepID=A0A177B566_9BILA|nr:hypothetical protein A3Q56_02796 [Intoshia linei]
MKHSIESILNLNKENYNFEDFENCKFSINNIIQNKNLLKFPLTEKIIKSKNLKYVYSNHHIDSNCIICALCGFESFNLYDHKCHLLNCIINARKNLYGGHLIDLNQNLNDAGFYRLKGIQGNGKFFLQSLVHSLNKNVCDVDMVYSNYSDEKMNNYEQINNYLQFIQPNESTCKIYDKNQNHIGFNISKKNKIAKFQETTVKKKFSCNLCIKSYSTSGSLKFHPCNEDYLIHVKKCFHTQKNPTEGPDAIFSWVS